MCTTCVSRYSDIIYPPTNIGHKSCTRDEQGRLHSIDDEPAIIFSTGTKMWYEHGKLHRNNAPAVVYNTTLVEYWEKGTYKRTGLTEKILVVDTALDMTECIDLETFQV